jgi:hypothetical protein
MGYPELESSEVIQSLNLPRSGSWPISVNIIDQDIYEQHCKVAKNINGTNKLVGKNLANKVLFSDVFKYVFNESKIDINQVFDEGNINELEEYEIKAIQEYGKCALMYHNELESFFDSMSIGFLWKSYMIYAENCRYAPNCDRWEGAFVAYCFMESSLLTKSHSDKDNVSIGVLLLLHYSQKLQNSEKFDASEIIEQSRMLLVLLNKFNAQKGKIEKMERWADNYLNHDKQYLSHGKFAKFTECSHGESLVNLASKARSLGCKLNTTGIAS